MKIDIYEKCPNCEGNIMHENIGCSLQQKCLVCDWHGNAYTISRIWAALAKAKQLWRDMYGNFNPTGGDEEEMTTILTVEEWRDMNAVLGSSDNQFHRRVARSATGGQAAED